MAVTKICARRGTRGGHMLRVMGEPSGRRPDPDEQLAIQQGWAALALQAGEMGEFEWDLERDLLFVSPRMAEITGLEPGSMPAEGGRKAYGFVHPEDVETLGLAMSDGLVGPGRYEVRYRWLRPDDGRLLWMYSAATAVAEPRGPPRRVIGVVQDLSARKAEDDEREALVAELDHRVKNVLAAVQSLASQSARKTVSIDAFLKTFSGRLEAMAAAHTLLTATRWRGAEIGHVAAAELGGLAPGQAHWEGPEILLNPRGTNALTLALHELATNAVKYGALSTDAGRVEVSWAARPEGGFELSWTEKDGPIVAVPARRGFGSILLERVTGRELGGCSSIEFHPGGVRAVLRADATCLAKPAAAEPIALRATRRPAEGVAGASLGAGGSGDIRGVTVLIVEDAVLLALELEAGLTEAGALVVGTAADLAEAERMLALSFDVAVLDANLNGEAVTPVATALRARGTPFIFATGYGEPCQAPDGFEAPVVRKPYNVHQIAAALQHALGRA
ncbi:MAG TPA: HWE histidine kinase domain-containing protein [Caulobacteraceae bacterium]